MAAEGATAPFELQIEIRDADIDALGHVNNAVYLRWIQEAATAHWDTLAPAAARQSLSWVVLRHEIDYHRAALRGDSILARTWVGAADGLSFERFTELLRAPDRSLLASARTLWCPIDLASGRPRRVGSEIRRLFSTAPAPDS